MRPITKGTTLPGSEEKSKVKMGESPSNIEIATVSVKPIVRQSGTHSMLGILFIALSALSQGIVPAWSQESEIAKQAQNPIARPISVPLENGLNPNTGPNREDSYVLQIKPVVPVSLSKDRNLIRRTITPVTQTPNPAPGVNGPSGSGDIDLSLFFRQQRSAASFGPPGPSLLFLQLQTTSLAQGYPPLAGLER